MGLLSAYKYIHIQSIFYTYMQNIHLYKGLVNILLHIHMYMYMYIIIYGYIDYKIIYFMVYINIIILNPLCETL